MLRNVILAISTVAVLALLYAAYALILGEPATKDRRRQAMSELTSPASAPAEPIRIGEIVEVPAGGKIIFRRYDEHTGRPKDMFLCSDWQPVPGTNNELRVSHPELSTLLPSGMIATISARTGQIVVDRVQQAEMKPVRGVLDGGVTLIVDKDTRPDRTPRQERPEDLIVIEMDRLDFNLETGELKTDGRVQLRAEDFEIAGTGLELVWNQAANRLDKLSIRQGEEFVLYSTARLFGMGPRPPATPPVATAPPAAPAAEERRPRRAPVAYSCLLAGPVEAAHYAGPQQLGALVADEVRLLLDTGGADAFLRGARSTTGPTSRPARSERERLVVHWAGEFSLAPVAPVAADAPSRRQFEARGERVVMTRGDGAVECGRVVYHDESERVWLHPVPGQPVRFSMGANLSATAESVYIDRANRIVKLMGAVEMRTRDGRTEPETTARRPPKRQGLSSMRCTSWAELHIAPGSSDQPRASGDPLVNAGQLERAVFTGDVDVDLGGQRLRSNRLDVRFEPTGEDGSIEAALRTALASGEVALTGKDSALRCVELALEFSRTSEDVLYPRAMDAAGTVAMSRKKAELRGARIKAQLGPPPPDPNGPAFVVRELGVHGGGELVDPENNIAARGREIRAAFEGSSELTHATVAGDADAQAMVHAAPYTIRGGEILLDRPAQTLRVDGPAHLSFRTRRSLQGQERATPVPIDVHSARLLHIDGRRNAVQFEGDVVAISGEEQLRSHTLALLLEDVEEAPSTQPAAGQPPTLLPSALTAPLARMLGLPQDATWPDLWRRIQGGGAASESDDLFALRVDDDRRRMRKEPVRLIAEQALVTSETFEPGSELPLLHASISAPRLEVDMVRRQIDTIGRTALLMTDRRVGRQDPESAVGAPTALLMRGPAQTAISCAGRMVYVLGPDGAQRRDSVVFEKEVTFAHRTGREMVNLAEMLPRLSEQPDLLAAAQSQNATMTCERLECWFVADEPNRPAARAGALTDSRLRLASLTASGSVYLSDLRWPELREVNAAWLEFSREQDRIHVRGAEGVLARIYVGNKQTNRFDRPYTGQRLVIHLRDGSIQSDRLQGEVRTR